MNYRYFTLFIVSILFSLKTFSDTPLTPYDDASLSIDKIEIIEVENPKIPNSLLLENRSRPINLHFDNILSSIDKLLAIGEKVIPLIEKGKAVYQNNRMNSISVIPNTEEVSPTLNQLSDWSLPRNKSYKVSFKNLYGVEVVSFVYTISFQYGGNLNGKGKYLTGVRVFPSNVRVLWGFDVDSSSELVQISNVGTNKNVIAAATIDISYTVKNILNIISKTDSFHITGNGKLIRL